MANVERVTEKEAELLKPWINEQVTKILGFEDPETASMAAVSLSKDVDRATTINTLRQLLEDGAAPFVNQFYDQLQILRTKGKAALTAVVKEEPKRPREEPPVTAEPKDDAKEPSKRRRFDQTADEKEKEHSHRSSDRSSDRHRSDDKDDRHHRSSRSSKDDRDRKEKDDRDHHKDRKEKDKERDRRDSSRSTSRKDEKEKEKEKEHRETKPVVSTTIPLPPSSAATTAAHPPTTAAAAAASAPAGTSIPSVNDIRAKIAAAIAAQKKTKEEQEKEKRIKQMAERVGISKEGEKPILRVDDQGREVDAEGNLIKQTAVVRATALANIKTQKVGLKAEKPSQTLNDPTKNPFFDPSMPTSTKISRGKKGFSFIEPGTYTKLERKMRRASEGDGGAAGGGAGGEEKPSVVVEGDGAISPVKMEGVTATDVSGKKQPTRAKDAIPDVEWWDQSVLRPEQLGDAVAGSVKFVPASNYECGLNEEKITHYVEHPVLIQPHHESKLPPPPPLMLTREERKKLRKRTRAEAQKEARERVLLGLEEPPPPKVKISNLYRVLGTQAVADPTALENKVRAEMAARLKAHHDRNQARKLTPEQRKEKKIKKLTEDTSVQVHVSLYKVKELLARPKAKYKVDINAQEHKLTGCVLICGDVTLVCVEGGPKALKKYKRLMLHRIDWNSEIAAEKSAATNATPADGATAGDGAATTAAPPAAAPAAANTIVSKLAPGEKNLCELIWEGTVSRQAFKNFRFENFENENAARKYLQDRGVGHYWDFAKTYQFGTNPVALVSEDKTRQNDSDAE